MSLERLSYQLVQNVQKFDYKLSYYEPYWEILFPDEKQQWHHLSISTYQNIFSIRHSNGESTDSLEIVPNKSVKIKTPLEDVIWNEDEELNESWQDLLQSANNWLEQVEKDWFQCNLQMQKEYPLAMRYGLIPHGLLPESLAAFPELNENLGLNKAKKFVELVEKGFFRELERPKVESMTAAKYFDYCKIAYLAIKENVDTHLSGREMYQLFADGRDEGLLELAPDSEREFDEWMNYKHPKRGGGHPWEIVRGGSFTNIGLRVIRPSEYYGKQGYKVQLYGHSFSRLTNTIKMFIAIHEAGLPIDIVEPEKTRIRLLGQDNVGIIPDYESLSHEDRHFLEEEMVFEAMYYEDLGKHKKLLTPFIRWEALPILRRRNF